MLIEHRGGEGHLRHVQRELTPPGAREQDLEHDILFWVGRGREGDARWEQGVERGKWRVPCGTGFMPF